MVSGSGVVVTWPLPSCTAMVTLPLKAKIGDPESTPEEESVSPSGTACAAKLYGGLPPVAPMDFEYGCPVYASGSAVMASCRGDSTLRVSGWSAVWPAEEAVTVKVASPGSAAVPERTPSVESERPAG